MAAPPFSASMRLTIAQSLFNTSDSETRKALLRQRGVAKDMRAWLEEHLGAPLVKRDANLMALLQQVKKYAKESMDEEDGQDLRLEAVDAESHEEPQTLVASQASATQDQASNVNSFIGV